MHFEILVEDQSGKRALEILLGKILAAKDHTWKIHSYKGIGHIPKNLGKISDPKNRILLEQLPKLLQGFGNTHASYEDFSSTVVVVCDLDLKCQKKFKENLLKVLEQCHPQPQTRFCIAVEEGEAWFLGDIPAIKSAYPKAKAPILNDYKNDSICGTWEVLADAISPGGSSALKAKGWQAVGAEKFKWAENISPHMDIEKNRSPSFNYFKNTLNSLAKSTEQST